MAKLSYSVIGIGQAGGTCANLWASLSEDKRSFFAINGSEEDLESLKNIEFLNHIQLVSIKGAAKSRKIARQAIENEYSNISQIIKARYEDIYVKESDTTQKKPLHLIFMIAAGGGGTGSGVLPFICKKFREDFKETAIVPVVIFPDLYESPIAHKNAIDCISELFTDKYTMMVINNARITGEKTLLTKYEKINHELIANIDRLANCEKLSRISNIDITDRYAMFKTPGLLTIGSAIVDKTNSSPLAHAVKTAIGNTPMVSNITSNVRKIALQFECEGELYTEENIAESEAIFKNTVGVFNGYYEEERKKQGDENTDDADIVNRVLIAIAGGKFPDKLRYEREAIVENAVIAEIEQVKFSNAGSKISSAWDEE
jgi:cell division GTPase FtsZ